jgi:hypothetical protein
MNHKSFDKALTIFAIIVFIIALILSITMIFIKIFCILTFLEIAKEYIPKILSNF